jgi:hypothetical protein
MIQIRQRSTVGKTAVKSSGRNDGEKPDPAFQRDSESLEGHAGPIAKYRPDTDDACTLVPTSTTFNALRTKPHSRDPRSSKP